MTVQVFQRDLRCVFEVNGGVERSAKLRHLSSGITEIICRPVLVRRCCLLYQGLVVPRWLRLRQLKLEVIQ